MDAVRGARAGFTLVELLVVVAIIAILAVIALPNLMEAQARAKVSRVKADHRALGIAFEAYRVDGNSYPIGNDWGVAAARPSIANDPPVLERLSTPIAYMTRGLLPDVFVARRRSNVAIDGTKPLDTNVAGPGWHDCPREGHRDHFLYRTYLYISTSTTRVTTGYADPPSGLWRVVNKYGGNADGFVLYSAAPMEAYINMGGALANFDRAASRALIYDPTNGTISFGNIFRCAGARGGSDNLLGAIDESRR